jgi:hypothetical protein
MMDTLLTLLSYAFLAFLLISGVVALLKEPGGLGLMVAVGVPALLGSIVAGWWLYQTCPSPARASPHCSLPASPAPPATKSGRF